MYFESSFESTEILLKIISRFCDNLISSDSTAVVSASICCSIAFSLCFATYCNFSFIRRFIAERFFRRNFSSNVSSLSSTRSSHRSKNTNFFYYKNSKFLNPKYLLQIYKYFCGQIGCLVI